MPNIEGVNLACNTLPYKIAAVRGAHHITQLLHAIETGVEFVTPLPIADLPIHCRDKEDDKFLACALGGSCDYLITNDNDLLILNGEKALGNLQIISAEAYLNR